jgi:polyphosphate kinase
VQTLFDFLEGKNDKPTFDRLLTAPFFLRTRLCEMIDQEIAAAKNGGRARIFLKMNSLQDPGMIQKLYEASNAGVEVRLIIRGICCLVPGVLGQSENIEIRSIVDRYLEHARIFWFGKDERESIFMASADWMTRNLDRRVEVAFPVLDPAISARVRSILDLQWSDNVKARIIDTHQRNEYVDPSGDPVRAQYAQYNELIQRGDQVS